MADSERITELLAEALQLLEEGGEEAFVRFLGEHEAEADELRSQIRGLQALGMLDAPAEAEATPERLGEYVLLERLGVGGMGVVYRAEQPSLQREVALKLIRPEHLFFPESRRRFQREVEAIARLQHPRIVRVYEAGEEGRLPYFAMELVQGVPLSRLLQRLRERGPARLDDGALREVLTEMRGDADEGVPLFRPRGRSWVEVCFRWARELAEALSYAHGAGVLHRDVKPSNVMITWDGHAMLLDFGLASTEGGSEITKSGAVLGSLAYMAPEQVRGEADSLSPRTDVYSLGVVLFEMLSLHHPFQDEDGTVEGTRRRILEGVPRRLSDHGQSIAWDTQTVCLAAMDHEPERRYADADALARDLDNVLGFRPIAARRAGAALRARRFVQRHPAASVGALLGLVLVVGGPLGLWRAQVAKTRAVQAEQRKTAAALLTVQKQRDEVTKQKDLAASRFEAAVRVVADVSDEIAFVELRDVPEAGPVRHELLDITSRSAERLLAEIPNHLEARKMASRIRFHRGVVFLEQDRYGEAEQLLEPAAAELHALWKEDPRDLRLAHQAATSLTNLGVIGYDRGDYEGAAALYYESMEILERALDGAEPGEVKSRLQHQLASCWLNLGSLPPDSGSALGSDVDALLEARAVIEKAIEEDAGVRNRSLLVMVLNNLAARTTDRAAALDYYREAVERSRGIEDAVPGMRDVRYNLAVAVGNLGHELIVVDTEESHAEADELVSEALERIRRLCLDYPERDDYRLALANTLLYRAFLDDRRRRPAAAALATLDECLDTYDALCLKGFPSAHLNRAIARQCLAGVHDREGHEDERIAACRRAYEDLRAASRQYPAWAVRYAQVMAQLRADLGDALDDTGESD